jgi:hypothetical protein
MIPIRYDFVRLAILFGLGALIVVLYLFLPHSVGVIMGLAFLAVLTGVAAIIPPGIYGWLIRPTCPNCRGRVEWAAVNPPGEPYNEQIVRTCRQCELSTVEWSYRT